MRSVNVPANNNSNRVHRTPVLHPTTVVRYTPGSRVSAPQSFWKITTALAAALLLPAPALAAGPYLQDTGADGIVSLEAEKYTGSEAAGGGAWTLSYPSGHSGSGAMEATPNAGLNVSSGFVGTTPRLDYRILFAKSGPHYIWVRGLGASASDNSLHAGLDGVPFATSTAIGDLPASLGWKNALMNGTVAMIDVPAPGEHTLNLWMREDGALVDKVVLTTNRSYAPGGAGPAASPTGQVAVTGTKLPVDLRNATPEEAAITYTVAKPAGAEAATLTLSTYDADFGDEGELFINGNAPIALFGSKASSANDNQNARIAFATPASYWKDGANQLVFRHNRSAGFTIDAVEVAFTGAAVSQSPPAPAPAPDGTAVNGAEVQLNMTGQVPEQYSVSLNLSKPSSASTALLTLDTFDADFQDEGTLVINGNPPLALFGKAGTSANDGNSASIAFETPAEYWRNGENVLEFTHTRTVGFIIDRVTVAFAAALTSSAINHPPTLEGSPATSIAVGQVYTFQPTAGDADGDPLLFSVQNLPSWASFSKSTGRLTGTPSSVGRFSDIRIAVSDGSAMASLPAFAIDIKDSGLMAFAAALGAASTSSTSNHPPTLQGSPATAVGVGQAYTFQPSASDADGDPLQFSVQNLPSWASFSTSTGRLTGTPGSVGQFSDIRIAVSDGSATASLPAFSIAVSEPGVGGSSSVTVQWSAPTSREDGTPLGSDDIAGYTVYSGPAPGSYPNAAWVAGGSQTSHTISNLKSGEPVYIVLTCVDRQGLESAPSAVTEVPLN